MTLHRQASRTIRILLLFLCILSAPLLPVRPASAAVTSTKDLIRVSGGKFIQNKTNGQWYYRQTDGTYLRDSLARIGKKTYYFGKNRQRKYGMQTIGSYTYCFGEKDEGYMYRSQWYTSSPRRVYYFAANGRMVAGKWLSLDGKLYYMNKKGIRLYGFHTIQGKRYYFGTYKQGYLYQSRHFTYQGNSYYCDADGVVATGTQVLPDGYTYYFDETGKAITGTQTYDDVTYYFSDRGQLLKKGLNLDISSQCALLLNMSTGLVEFSRNSAMPHANASTTKIMTALLTLENAKLSDTVTASAYAASMEPTKLYMSAGEQFRLRDLLYSLLVPSHNDTAVALAEHVAGTEAAFVEKMNVRAAQLGCTSTHFATPNGLDAGYTHYTTCEDLAKIAIYTYKKFPLFRKIIKTTTYTFQNKAGDTYTVSTTKRLLKEGTAGVVGMKTGYTNKAGHCFVGVCQTKQGHSYLCVILGGATSDKRWEDAETLLSYAYDNL